MASSKTVRQIQVCIWLYFWLLVFEGALRKWIVPQFSAPLLIIRDPLVLYIYFLALVHGLFPRRKLTLSIIGLAVLTLFGSLATNISGNGTLFVTLYGLRTNFLHLPLIFVIPKVFNLKDVRSLGKWVLLLAGPLSMLMVYQFTAPPSDFLNRTAYDEALGATLLTSALGRVRPPATFSAVNGAALYLALVAAFFLYAVLQKQVYKSYVLMIGGVSLAAALAVSGSRTALALVSAVLAGALVSMVIQPKLFLRSYRLLILIAVAVLGLGSTTFFSRGIETLTTRIETASGHEAATGGFFGRIAASFIEPSGYFFTDLPLFGYGLGMGTNVGAVLVSGTTQFLLAEVEWSRVILESGLIFGLLYIAWRVALTGWLGWVCLKSTFSGNILPLLLFGTCGLNLLNGQISQPTVLGFAALGGGLCLAACRKPEVKSAQAISDHERITDRQLPA